MLSPSEWPTTFSEDLQPIVFNNRRKDNEDIGLGAETKKRMEQDMKQNNWELELEKIKQQFMNSTPFKTRLISDGINTYDGNMGRQELQQAKNKVLSDFSQANFHRDASENLFKVEFDVYEFDPETVKVRLEDDTLVVEAKQLTQEGDSHRSKREFYRRVVVPSGANSDRMICKLSAAGFLEVKIPAPPSYSEALKDTKKNVDLQKELKPSKPESTTQDTTDYTPSTTTSYAPSTTEYTTISSSPRRHIIRTKEYVPQYTRSSPEYRPSTIEYTYSTKRSPMTRGYTSTTEYVPNSTSYVTSTTRFTPSKEYTPGISRKSTSFTGYSPTKYSTLPSRPKHRSSSSSSRVYLGSSGSNTIDPKWRTRQQKISLSDSLDSEATLSSSPSDDLYYGHSSFSDLDL